MFTRTVKCIVCSAPVRRRVNSLLVNLYSLMRGNPRRSIFRCASLLKMRLTLHFALVRCSSSLNLRLLYSCRLVRHLLYWSRLLLLNHRPEIMWNCIWGLSGIQLLLILGWVAHCLSKRRLLQLHHYRISLCWLALHGTRLPPLRGCLGHMSCGNLLLGPQRWFHARVGLLIRGRLTQELVCKDGIVWRATTLQLFDPFNYFYAMKPDFNSKVLL